MIVSLLSIVSVFLEVHVGMGSWWTKGEHFSERRSTQTHSHGTRRQGWRLPASCSSFRWICVGVRRRGLIITPTPLKFSIPIARCSFIVQVHESRLLPKNVELAFDRMKFVLDRHLNGDNCYEEQYKRLQVEREMKVWSIPGVILRRRGLQPGSSLRFSYHTVGDRKDFLLSFSSMQDSQFTFRRNEIVKSSER